MTTRRVEVTTVKNCPLMKAVLRRQMKLHITTVIRAQTDIIDIMITLKSNQFVILRKIKQ